MEDNTPVFKSPTEEIQYWKSKYQQKVQEFNDLEESFNDFQDSSRELEKEMEKDLERSEKRLSEVTSQYHKLKAESDATMEKSRRNAEDSGTMIHHLQDELEILKRTHRESQRIQQKLEHDNDTLERREREHASSITDLTDKVNKLLEDNAWLQTELDETRLKYQEVSQRTKEELKDLQMELDMKDRAREEKMRGAGLVTPDGQMVGSLQRSNSTLPLPSTPMGKSDLFPPSKSATTKNSLIMVNEMVQLVKDMESRLNAMKVEGPRTPRGYGSDSAMSTPIRV
ncbi:Lis-interacting protein [Planoprotostelium fungivorum]|uniref:Lis-interacting protein n=1 Tax=Planoprotostelium fungivorum TaxID=1890364 RepID=A0A2P6NHE6_9EUKA|nr:Lis-interacting protein [Planoprotostelium fungivorum]